MAALAQVEATALLNASFGKVTFPTPTTPMMLRLMTANGSATAAGTQVTGGTYTPQNLTTALGTAASGSITTTGAVTFTLMPAATVVGVEVWDSAGTPVRKWFGTTTSSITTTAGDTVTFAIGAISASLA